MDCENVLLKVESDDNDEITLGEREIKPRIFEPKLKPMVKCTLCYKLTTDLLRHNTNYHVTCNVCAKVCNNQPEYKQHKKVHEKLLHNIVINCDSSSDSEVEFSAVSSGDGKVDLLNGKTTGHSEQDKLQSNAEFFNVDCKLPWSDSEDDAVEDFQIADVEHKPSPVPFNSNKYLCSFCNDSIKQNLMKKHKAEFHSIIMCEVCGAEVNHRRFSYHENLHIEKYKCSVCNKVFAKQTSLDVHIRMEHTGKAIIICEICGKEFFTVKHLNMHVARHNKILNYTCNLCQKKFFNSFSLKSHMRQHTDERPYQCECGEAFKHNVSLKAHKKSKHGIVEEKKLQCKMCEKKFATHGARLTHMRKHKT